MKVLVIENEAQTIHSLYLHPNIDRLFPFKKVHIFL